MIRNINIIWIRVAIILITILGIAAAVGIAIFSAPQYQDDAESIILKQLDAGAEEGCYLKIIDGSCVARTEIGFIEQASVDELCIRMNCSNAIEYQRAVTSIIIYENQQDKKVVFLH